MINEPIFQSHPKADYDADAEEIDAAISRTLKSGWFILGKETRSFEEEFAGFLGVDHAIGVGNGTDALVIALRAIGVGAGDAVLTVAHTAVATVAAIEMAGAYPVLVDIDPESYTLCPHSLSTTIQEYQKKATTGAPVLKAVIVVHLYGHVADLDAISKVVQRHGLQLVEDCAQSHGAQYRGRKGGSFGAVSAFSFYPTKNLGALGDGGAVVTSDPGIAARARLLREYGWRERYISEISGVNSRLDEIHSAVLRVKLKKLDGKNASRRAIAERYHFALQSLGYEVPRVAADVEHVYHQYVIRKKGRDVLKAFLADNGVGTLIHYPVPVHRQPAYQDKVWRTELPHTESAAREVLSLPMYPQLTNLQADRVIEEVKKFPAQAASSA